MQPRHISARTSYFAVADEILFLIWVDTLPGVEARQRQRPSSGTALQPVYALVASPKDPDARPAPTASDTNLNGYYGFPTHRIGAGDGLEEIDLADEISNHLCAGDCVLIVESATSAHPAAVGRIRAVHPCGEVVSLDFCKVVDRAAYAGWSLPYSSLALPTGPVE